MFLKSVTLRDWKAYGGEARFDFPTPTRRKNVILVGAQNGFGKTSLLEALLFGLYGRDALPYIARANRTVEKESERGYPAFLQRAIHSVAIEEGRTSMTVELAFEDTDDEIGELTLSRTWYFRGDGSFREEQVHIYTGAERRPLRPPRLEDDSEDYFRGYVARATLPAHLAQFFLFDGEQVQRLAQTDLASQVRIGIEGMLGATVLRTLEKDLQSYARDRRTRLRDVANDDTLERVRVELEQLQEQQDRLNQELATLSEELPATQKRRDELAGKLQGLQGGNIDNVKELQRKKDAAEQELARQKEQLFQLLTVDLALAVAGRPLRDKVRTRMVQERELAAWEGGIQNSTRQLSRFREEFDRAVPPFAPALTEGQRAALETKIDAAWREMWHPPPDSCAPFYRHSYLADADRHFVLERVESIDGMGQSGIQDLLHNIAANDADRTRLDQQISAFQAIGPQLATLVDQLQELMVETATKTARKSQVERELAGVKAQVAAKKTEYQRLSSKNATAKPELARIALAEKIATMLPDLVDAATGTWVNDVADRMTEAYREIAHKGTVDRVTIDPECNVRLMTKGGQDYRSLDASAGEDQVFSFALISAVARAAQIRFPIVIDTPLARLDRDHRVNILRHFTERAGEQIILLSQDTEVVGEYLEVVRDRVARSFLIEHKQIGEGFGQNRVVANRYFEKV